MRKLFYLGLLIVITISCRKENPNPITPPEEGTTYLPLSVGNYWIYEHYKIDSLGNETTLNFRDSVAVTKDTTINNNQYFVIEGTNYPINYQWGTISTLRDSNGFIVDTNGNISFSTDNFNDILASKTEVINNDTIYTLTFQMEDPKSLISVPAGEFEVLDFKGTLITFPQIKKISNPRFINNYYSKNVGKVLNTYYYISQPATFEKRLIRFNINKE